jgi:acyl dehydratase
MIDTLDQLSSKYWYEDFAPGARHDSDWRIITDADVAAFMDLTGGRSEVCEQVPFQMLFGIATGLSAGLGLFSGALIAFCGVESMLCHRTTSAGGIVRVRKRVAAVQAVGATRGFVTFDTELHDADGVALLTYRDKFLFRKREGHGNE